MQEFSFMDAEIAWIVIVPSTDAFDTNKAIALTKRAHKIPMRKDFNAGRPEKFFWRACMSFLFAALWILLSLSFAKTCSAQKPLTTPGLVRELSGSFQEVREAVINVQKDHIVHGTKVFEREPILTGAEDSDTCALFEPWQGAGQVLFKIRKDSIAPRHFLETGDIGTICVRYVILPVTADRTRVKVDAVYVENARKTVHPSDGTVEAAEMKEIKESLDAMQQAAADAAEARRRSQSAELVRQSYVRQKEDESTRLQNLQDNQKMLETEITSLRHEIERRVKAPGTDLKAAPFQSAASLKPLSAFTEVVVLIVTPHWLGVETPEGQRGWLPIEKLEPLP
jgi:hypothetical protein